MRILTRRRLVVPAFLGMSLFLWKTPHIALLARAARGDFAGAAVPVTDFTPAGLDGETVPLRVGLLTVSVPRTVFDVTPEPASTESLRLHGEGFGGWLAPPSTHSPGEPEDRDCLPRGSSRLGGDAVEVAAAAYRASPRDLSLRMSTEQVRSLEMLLKAKAALTLPAERVEVVRTKDVKGLLLFRTLADGRTAMIFEYSSTTGRAAGQAIFLVDGQSGPAMDLARAVVSSLSLERGLALRRDRADDDDG
jgi:hypothetical protein